MNPSPKNLAEIFLEEAEFHAREYSTVIAERYFGRGKDFHKQAMAT